MSLRDVIEAEMNCTGESSLASALETAGFADVDATLVNEALLHYAQSAPLEQADSLEQLVTSYHRQSVGITQQEETQADDPFGLDVPLNQWLTENDPAELDNLEDYDITELDLEAADVDHGELDSSTEIIEFGAGSEVAEAVDTTGELFESDVDQSVEAAPVWDEADIAEPAFVSDSIEENVVELTDLDDDNASDFDDIDFD